jgi:TolB-like protein
MRRGRTSGLQAHFAELVNPKIEEHWGRVVKNTGDGLLAEFASVVDAVRCAVEMQQGMAECNSGISAPERIEFRVGINLGDVIVEEHDIFGDGVNVAARLEAIAEPGGICISRTARDQVRDKLPYRFEDRGEQSVKNIARPVRVYALQPEDIAALPTARVSAKWISQPAVAPRLSIVVLPFANLSNDPEQQYFADAITDDLTTDLSRLAGMMVISRNTAFTYRNKSIDTKQIGRELGMRYVLEGSVQRSSNQVRVNAHLVDAETDTHLWSDRFAGDISDLFALQDDITGRIANALSLALISMEAARPTENPDALDYIFQGRAAFNRQTTPANLAKAIGLFERALELDPHSAEAKSWLARTLVGRASNQMSGTDADDIAGADQLIAQALAISPAIQMHITPKVFSWLSRTDAWRPFLNLRRWSLPIATGRLRSPNSAGAGSSLGR